MEDMTFKIQLRQELRLTPQLLQSMEVLQMTSQELLDYIGRISEENPLVEPQMDREMERAWQDLRRKAAWLSDAPVPVSGGVPERGAWDTEAESLTAFLCDQLERLRLKKPLLTLCRCMAGLVDEDGRLLEEDLESLAELPRELVEEAVGVLQSLEPAGVGAKDLSQCLLLQLGRKRNVPEGTEEIVRRFLPELGRRHYGPITRALGLSRRQVAEAEQCIASLDPYPGRAFAPEQEAEYVRPDVFIVESEGQLQVVLNEYCLPRITISDYYRKLLGQTDEAQTREYLRQKLQQANWLVGSLARRGETLRRCCQIVLETQRGFFEGQTQELVPMSLSDAADALSMHPSTVSRALRGKYLQCRQGTWPIRYFFSRAVGDASQQAIRRRMLALIRAEDPAHPLSDQQLCAALSVQGVKAARRTIAKYRRELGIPASCARKNDK